MGGEKGARCKAEFRPVVSRGEHEEKSERKKYRESCESCIARNLRKEKPVCHSHGNEPKQRQSRRVKRKTQARERQPHEGEGSERGTGDELAGAQADEGEGQEADGA